MYTDISVIYANGSSEFRLLFGNGLELIIIILWLYHKSDNIYIYILYHKTDLNISACHSIFRDHGISFEALKYI